jgi:hypothetical protein
MRQYEDVDWHMSYDEYKITIRVNSLKCKDIDYTEVIETITPIPYSDEDKNKMFEIRDSLMKKVYKEQKNRLSDAEFALDNFIKTNSGIWDLNDTKEFLMEYKNEVIKLLRCL